MKIGDTVRFHNEIAHKACGHGVIESFRSHWSGQTVMVRWERTTRVNGVSREKRWAIMKVEN